jgi:hypothetical protein
LIELLRRYDLRSAQLLRAIQVEIRKLELRLGLL